MYEDHKYVPAGMSMESVFWWDDHDILCGLDSGLYDAVGEGYP